MSSAAKRVALRRAQRLATKVAQATSPVINPIPVYAIVIISCEYVKYAQSGQLERLPGCHADAKSILALLKRNYPIVDADVRVLTDDPSVRGYAQPTHRAITEALQWLVQRANVGATRLVLYYSGHGTQVTDLSGDEVDRRDEAIVPCDFMTAGMLTDDAISSTLTTKLPASCKLVALYDSCNSGTVMDLKNIYTSSGVLASSSTAKQVVANVVSISGCRDNQTSASDYNIDGIRQGWRGAMTYCLEKTIKDHNTPAVNCETFINALRNHLASRGYTQVPELCSSQSILTSPLFWS